MSAKWRVRSRARARARTGGARGARGGQLEGGAHGWCEGVGSGCGGGGADCAQQRDASCCGARARVREREGERSPGARRSRRVGWEGSTRHPAGMRGGKAAAAMARDVGGRAQPHHLMESAALGGSDGSSNGTDDDDRTRSGKQSRRPPDSLREDALPSALGKMACEDSALSMLLDPVAGAGAGYCDQSSGVGVRPRARRAPLVERTRSDASTAGSRTQGEPSVRTRPSH